VRNIPLFVAQPIPSHSLEGAAETSVQDLPNIGHQVKAQPRANRPCVPQILLNTTTCRRYRTYKNVHCRVLFECL